uniref:NAD-dependent epimerase/dehydratase domain-containing protein n=1 Tax=Glycine max TaxID=3847 RepID=A0A0R0G7G5_SOYBN
MELGIRSPVHATLFHHFSNSLLFPARLTLLNTTSSSFMATHLHVSSEEFDPSPSLAIGQHDLLIVGPGILGRLVAHNWRQWTKASLKFPYVIFCAPPYQSSDYLGDLRLAASCWNGEGALLFTSSSAPYDCNDNGLCHEDSPVVPTGRSPRTDVLLKAEKIVLEFGGSVLRLSGLYKVDKGAHAYWLEKGIVESRPDHILNLIHYEDAASLSVAILKKQFRGRIFLGCDNHPLSRQEVMDLVYKSGKFSKKFEKFTGTDDPLGKRLNNSRTRQEVGWEPKYSSFAHFLETI